MLTGELDVDHVQKRWHGAQTDRLENLIPLCRWCHAAKDHGSGKGIKLRVSAERPKGRHGEAEQFNGFWFWWV
jgi:5-methylcytosine-specific restriction endonuclease McrA